MNLKPAAEDALKSLLDEKILLYNTPAFIKTDPITIPHRFSRKQDIEIAGFFAATLAWGNRTSIINNCTRLLNWMDNAPHQFILNHQPEDLKPMLQFAHRTFNATDLLYFIETLQRHYQAFDSMEDAFFPAGVGAGAWGHAIDAEAGAKPPAADAISFELQAMSGEEHASNPEIPAIDPDALAIVPEADANDAEHLAIGPDVGAIDRKAHAIDAEQGANDSEPGAKALGARRKKAAAAPGTVGEALIRFNHYFFQGEYPERTRKHVSTPERGSACKRLCMFLRWMVRSDAAGVDFGIWKRITPAELICPLDVHVARVAHRLGLTSRPNADWRSALELTAVLRRWRPEDPAIYDYALFGLGAEERF